MFFCCTNDWRVPIWYGQKFKYFTIGSIYKNEQNSISACVFFSHFFFEAFWFSHSIDSIAFNCFEMLDNWLGAHVHAETSDDWFTPKQMKCFLRSELDFIWICLVHRSFLSAALKWIRYYSLLAHDCNGLLSNACHCHLFVFLLLPHDTEILFNSN